MVSKRSVVVPTLSGSLAGAITDYLDARGLPARACRARLALWRPDGRVPASEWAVCLYLAWLEDPRPALGLEIARFSQPEHMGLLAYLALSCDDIGELLQQFDRRHQLMWQGFKVSTHRSDGIFTVTWAMPDPPAPADLEGSRLAFETGLGGIVQVFRILCGDPHTPCAVTLLGAPPPAIEPYEAFFRCPVSFSPTISSLSFTAATLRMPISAKETVLRQLVERQGEAQLRANDSRDAFLAALRRALSRGLTVGTPTIAFVAAELAVSRVTVQRRLNAAGTGFQEILDKTRYEMARMYIENPRLSLAEISMLLAFSEQSAFCRAFRRWSGETPRRFRRNLAVRERQLHQPD